MGSGNKGLYSGAYTGDSSLERTGNGPRSGSDYNTAGSRSVGKVTSITTTSNVHSIPAQGSPNSVSKNFKNGKLDSERYYGSDGKAYLDIDYSDHGNSKTHPNVPHEHAIYFDENGRLHRQNEPEGGLNK